MKYIKDFEKEFAKKIVNYIKKEKIEVEKILNLDNIKNFDYEENNLYFDIEDLKFETINDINEDNIRNKILDNFNYENIKKMVLEKLNK